MMEGGWSTLPRAISMTDGNWRLPYVDFYEYGPTPIYEAWNCYQIATHCQDKLLFISAPTFYNSDTDSLFVDTYKFKVLKQTTNGFRIAWQTHRSREEYQEIEVADFILVEDGSVSPEQMMCYPSEYDMFIDLLARFRETFGNEVDKTLYLTYEISDPIINFDELEEILLAPYRD